MCRILGIVKQANIEPDELDLYWKSISDMALDITTDHEHHKHTPKGEFRHDDGFGYMYMNNELKMYKSAEEIWTVKLDESEKKNICSTNNLIIHVRKASPGLSKKNKLYAHPFVKNSKFGTIGLIHNGGIGDQSTIEFNNCSLEAENSDSEKLLCSIISMINNYDRLDNTQFAKDLNNLIETIREKNEKPISANLMILFNNNFWATNNYEVRPKYMQMKYLMDKDRIIVSSEVISSIKGDWVDFPLGKILRVNLNDINDREFIS